jgi:transcriptional regulator with XRE-family HTH domain
MVSDHETPDTAGMRTNLSNRLRKARDVARLTQAELAEQIGVTSQAVSQWERGETKPEVRNLRRIAVTLQVPLTELIILMGEDADHRRTTSLVQDVIETGEPPVLPPVAVVGYVGAGAKTHFYAVAQGDLDEVSAPAGATPNTVAVEIRGDSLGALFDRWLVLYDDVRSPVTPDLIGKLCVVGLRDDRILIKKLHRSKVPGTFDLISEREEPIRGVVVDWAAKVKTMVAR